MPRRRSKMPARTPRSCPLQYVHRRSFLLLMAAAALIDQYAFALSHPERYRTEIELTATFLCNSWKSLRGPRVQVRGEPPPGAGEAGPATILAPAPLGPAGIGSGGRVNWDRIKKKYWTEIGRKHQRRRRRRQAHGKSQQRGPRTGRFQVKAEEEIDAAAVSSNGKYKHCAWCGIPHASTERDHIIPTSAYGDNASLLLCGTL